MVFGLVAALLGGCAGSRPQASRDYNVLFAEHHYTAAYDAAAKVAGQRDALQRDQASLVAGLSARSMDRTDDAKRWLAPLVGNADANIAGQAGAALGAIAQEDGRHKDAAMLFRGAAEKLKGDDAARASMYAGDSLRKLKRNAEAKDAYEKAQALGTDPGLQLAITDRLRGVGTGTIPKTTTASSSGRYTVQTAAYSDLNKARKEAGKLATRGGARAVPIRDHAGRTLYAVQVGRYASKQAAESASRGFGPKAFVTAYD